MYLQKKETILIVDDSKFQRAIINEMLGEHFISKKPLQAKNV